MGQGEGGIVGGREGVRREEGEGREGRERKELRLKVEPTEIFCWHVQCHDWVQGFKGSGQPTLDLG